MAYSKNNILRFSGLGFQMMAVIGLGIWGGLKLDELTGYKPLFTLVLSLTGLGSSLYLIIREVLGKNKNQ